MQRGEEGSGEVSQMTEQMEQEYQRLQKRYEAMGMEMSEPMQRAYGEMQQMHDQTMQMHGRMMNEGMMGRMQGRGMGPQGEQLWERHQQMMAMHGSMAQMHQREGRDSLMAMHRQMARLHEGMMEQLPAGDELETAPETRSEADIGGQQVYRQNCSSCHGQDLQGLAGAFPPLVGTEWVTGDPTVPIRIVLYGLQGPIEVKEQTYNGVMPAFGSRLSDAQVAAVVSYLRSTGDGEAGGVSAEEVQVIRQEYGERRRPFEAEELTE